MSDLLEDDEPTGNAPEFTVSEISGAVKKSIESAFSHVRVRGELGRVVHARSGHVYTDLKDERAVLSGVIWKGTAQRLVTKPEEGLEVIATGRLTTFPGQSRYQLVIEDIRPAGVGALMAMLEKRRAALQAEGLFDPARKQALPFLPRSIGVITSPQGAVIRDILHRLRDRFPRPVYLWPVAVQGKDCAPQVAAAIRGFNALPAAGGPVPRPDLLIVARGGGSIEDLWGFNEEIVVRAAADSTIPLISAVGHETDTTLIDHASDRRAPTPTAAAEIAVPVRLELLAWTQGQGERLLRGLTRRMETQRQRLTDLGRVLPRPDALTGPHRQRLDALEERLPNALRSRVARTRVDLAERGGLRPALLTRRLDGLSQRVREFEARLTPVLGRLLQTKSRAHSAVAVRLSGGAVLRDIAVRRTSLERVGARLDAAQTSVLRNAGDRLAGLERVRKSVGYVATLQRGYAVVRSGDAVVTGRAEAQEHASLEIEFRDGRLPVAPTARGQSAAAPASEEPAPAKSAARKSGPRKPASRGGTRTDGSQGSLF